MEFVKAFLIGGLLCVIGQLLIDFTKLTPARILVSYVTAGVVLTAVGFTSRWWILPGAGATVPLTGFGYTLAMGVRQAVEETGWLGIFYRRLYSRGGRGGRGGAVRLFGGALLPVGG